MGAKTGIDWTDHTWNPWQGCHKVSAGCEHCYMYREKGQYGQDPTVVVRSKPATFRSPLKYKEPARVFVCSWSDFFIEEADPWRDEAWEIMRATPHLTYQILTKRSERMADHLPKDWGRGWEHVWLGMTCENQAMAEARIPLLLQTPAAVRFVSAEPLLGPVDLAHAGDGPCVEWWENGGISWIIVGGESGPGARPMHPEWVRAIRDQCVSAKVPFFFKQWGEWTPWNHCGQHAGGKDVIWFPDGQCMARVGTRAAGCLLDGREWKEFPDGATCL